MRLRLQTKRGLLPNAVLDEYCLPGLLIRKLSECCTQISKICKRKQPKRYLCVTQTVNWQLMFDAKPFSFLPLYYRCINTGNVD